MPGLMGVNPCWRFSARRAGPLKQLPIGRSLVFYAKYIRYDKNVRLIDLLHRVLFLKEEKKLLRYTNEK